MKERGFYHFIADSYNFTRFYGVFYGCNEVNLLILCELLICGVQEIGVSFLHQSNAHNRVQALSQSEAEQPDTREPTE